MPFRTEAWSILLGREFYKAKSFHVSRSQAASAPFFLLLAVCKNGLQVIKNWIQGKSGKEARTYLI